MAAASASTGGGVLSPPFLMAAAYTKHHNRRRICQHNNNNNSSIKQNHLRIISPSKFSISAAFPKHNNNLDGVYPSKFDNCSRGGGGSLFQCHCSSSEIAAAAAESEDTNKRSSSSSRGVVSMIDRFKSVIDRFKSMMYQHLLPHPPPPPRFYRIINLEVIVVPQNHVKEVKFEEYFKNFKNVCNLCQDYLAEQDTREMLFGDIFRKVLVYLTAELLQILHKYCICSRSSVCTSNGDPLEEFPFILGHPLFFYMEDHSFDNSAAYKFQLLVYIDGEKSIESIGKCDNNLEHFLPQLSSFAGKFYGVQVNYERIMLRRKNCGVGTPYSASYQPYLFCEDH